MKQQAQTFESFEAVRPHKIWPGVLAHEIRGESVAIALVDLEPNVPVAEHSHPNEQLGFIVKGTFIFTIGGETRELKAGDTYSIPPGVPHSAVTGPEGAVAIDVFSPPRQDWDKLERGETRQPSWP